MVAEMVGPANAGFGAVTVGAGIGDLSGAILLGFSMLRRSSVLFGISDVTIGAAGIGVESMTTPVLASTVFSALESELDGKGMADGRATLGAPRAVEWIAGADSGNTCCFGFSSTPVTILSGM